MDVLGISDFFYEIAFRSDYPSLIRLCQTERSIQSMCQNEVFWRQRVQRDFGVAELKPPGISFRDQYHSLYFLPSLDEAIINWRLDQVVLLYNRGIYPSSEQMHLVSRTGDLRMLDWFAQRHFLPDRYLDAALIERIDLLDWLWDNKVPLDEDVIYNDIATTLTGAIIEELGPKAVPILIWLNEHGLDLDFNVANEAAYNGNIELLSWFENQGILPDDEGANLAAGQNHLQVLDWLDQRGILPDTDGGRAAAGAGYLNVLDWLEAHGVYFDRSWIYEAAGYNRVDVLNWIEKRATDYSRKYGPLNWLERAAAGSALLRGSLDSLNWLYERKIYPSESAIEHVYENGPSKSIAWLREHPHTEDFS